MGAILGAVKMVGAVASGVGACVATEGAILAFKQTELVARSKVLQFCMDAAAVTLGGTAFEFTAKEFCRQCDETEELFDKMKELRENVRKRREQKKYDTDLEARMKAQEGANGGK